MSIETEDYPGYHAEDGVVYHDCDGKRMSDDTLHFEWIVTIKEGLAALFADRPDVFVAGDLLWYPVRGDAKTRLAPDAMVAFGRPPGFRGSYMQWREGDVAPQVVFEVQSRKNFEPEMARKRAFYERYGVEEYYQYRYEKNRLRGWVRRGDAFEPVPSMQGFTSPLLGVRFDSEPGPLRMTRPDGREFQSYADLFQESESVRLDAERDAKRATAAERLLRVQQLRADAMLITIDLEKQRADAESRIARAEGARADAEKARADALAAKLRAFGIEPD